MPGEGDDGNTCAAWGAYGSQAGGGGESGVPKEPACARRSSDEDAGDGRLTVCAEARGAAWIATSAIDHARMNRRMRTR